MAAIMSLDEPRPSGTNDAYGIRASIFGTTGLLAIFLFFSVAEH